MADLDIDFFRALLLARRQETLALNDARRASQQTVELDQSRVGRLSRMDALQQQAMAQATQRNTDLMLLEIKAALLRCEEGSFGLCCECDEPIGEKRLHIAPTSRKCIACAQHEK